jgi:hypothetical protein
LAVTCNERKNGIFVAMQVTNADAQTRRICRRGAMSSKKEDSIRQKVPCAQCLKEVPVSEAKVAEAVDYVAYFCGLDCYAKWAKQEEGPECLRPKP